MPPGEQPGGEQCATGAQEGGEHGGQRVQGDRQRDRVQQEHRPLGGDAAGGDPAEHEEPRVAEQQPVAPQRPQPISQFLRQLLPGLAGRWSVVGGTQPDQAVGAEQVGEGVPHEQHRRPEPGGHRAGEGTRHGAGQHLGGLEAAPGPTDVRHPERVQMGEVEPVHRQVDHAEHHVERHQPAEVQRPGQTGDRAGPHHRRRAQVGDDQRPPGAPDPVEQDTADRSEQQRRQHAGGHHQGDVPRAGAEAGHRDHRDRGRGQGAAEHRGELTHQEQPEVAVGDGAGRHRRHPRAVRGQRGPLRRVERHPVVGGASPNREAVGHGEGRHRR